jgi:hypothetical protein
MNVKKSIEETKNSICLIDKYDTPLEKNKIPYKKLNYKMHFYKKRLNYGRLSNAGFLNNNLRLLPTLDFVNDNQSNIANMISIPNNYESTKYGHTQNQRLPIDEDLMKKLIYDCDMDFNIRESKREINLKKMLEEKMKKLALLTNYSTSQIG